MTAPASPPPVVLFDGVCNLCNGFVQFVLDRERAPRLRFAALQSEAARALLAEHGASVPAGDPDSIALVEDGRVWERSAAVLRVVRHLRWPWRALALLRLVPAPLRDVVYRAVAARRYAWFGRSAACRLPTPELRARFLADDPPAATG